MSCIEQLQHIFDKGIVAVIRAESGEQLVDVARALYEGGVDVLEVTFTVPGVLEIISAVKKDLGNKILLGTGTVLDTETARTAILAGAEFLVTPIVNTNVIKLCNRYSKIVMSGAFTPTEVMTAWEAGADIVKIFPAEIGGPKHLKTLLGPFPQVKLMPTGGVNLNTLESFVDAGACAVGLGSALVEKQAVKEGNMDRIRDLARQYTELWQRIGNR